MPHSVKENLLAAFSYLLKPLVRLAIKNAVTFPEFSESLKAAYVDVAARQLRASGKAPSDEGIALIANVAVNEVSGVLNAEARIKFGAAAQESNPLPTALAAWHTDVKYTGPYGVLRDIEFARSGHPSERSNHSFTDLAEEYCPGVSPRVLLDELIRTECVQDVGNGYFRAVKRSYIPDPLSAGSIFLLARVVHNLCETLEFNLRAETAGGNTKRLIERTIYTVHGINRDELPHFDKYIRVRGQAFADDIDNWLSTRDLEENTDAVQMGVGFYQYIVNEEDELALSKELPSIIAN